MAEVTVVKNPKPDRPELARWVGFETPLFRGSLFGLNPFALMRQFTEDMDRVFNYAPLAPGTGAAWSPVIEVKEKEGKLLVTAELPGVKREDVKVHVDGDTLVVEGERKEEKEEKREGYYHSERTYGNFYRTIPLPEGVKTETIKAHFDNGVLEIAVPAPELKAKEKTKEIPITEGTKTEETKKAA